MARTYTANVPQTEAHDFSQHWSAYSKAKMEFVEHDADGDQVVKIIATPEQYAGVEEAFNDYNAPFVYEDIDD